jgi:NADPH-dependent 2,4-dienoyl-CoA reductase/sulfur reductase-like enzyme
LRDKTVAVIGSGMTGLETAELLAEQGNNVTVYEMMDTIGPGAYFQNLIDVTMKLNKLGVSMLPSHKLAKITDEKIVLEKVDTKEIVEAPVDAVILSLGVRSNNQMEDAIKSAFTNVKVIGDASKPRKIAQAISEGFEEAYKL